MKAKRALLALAISAAVLGTAGYAIGQTRAAADTAANETADQFVARVNQTIKDLTPEITSASWLAATYINEDSQRIESAANERFLTLNNEFIEQAKAYGTDGLSPATARALHLLKTSSSLPAPRDPAKLKELTEITSRMGATYGAGQWCKPGETGDACSDIGEISEVLADTENSSWDEMKAAWEGWHAIAVPIRKDYQRFVELTNEGARDMGYPDTGAVWRSGYDMPSTWPLSPYSSTSLPRV